MSQITEHSDNSNLPKNKCLFVSGFIDIDRGKWNSYYARSTDKYINSFGTIIKKGYNIVCFCERDTSQKLIDRFGFFNTLPIKKEESFFRYIEKEKKIMQSESYKTLVRGRNNNGSFYDNPEYTVPEYNLATHNKAYYLNEAKKVYPDYTHYIWIDFAYGHAFAESKIPKDIDVNKFDDRINVSSLCNMFYSQSLTRQENCKMAKEIIDGGCVIVPNNLVEWYYEKYDKELNRFYNLNIVDDDQAIVMYLALDNIDKFHVRYCSEWACLLRDYFKL